MNSTPDPTDRLLDSLLHEQHRNAPDEALLRAIDAAIAATPAKLAVSTRTAPARRRSYGKPLAAAAVLALSTTAVVIWRSETQRLAEPLAATAMTRHSPSPGNAEIPRKAPLSRHADLWSRKPSPFAAPPSATQTAPPTDESAAAIAQSTAALRRGLDETSSNGAKDRSLAQLSPPMNLEGMDVAPRPPAGVGMGFGQGSGSGSGMSGGLGGNGLGKGFGKGLSPGAVAPPASRMPKERAGGNWLDGEPAPPPAAGTGIADPSRDQYNRLIDPPWKSPWNDALSTFSIDVDAASYTNVRKMILSGRPVPPDAVRIEECINYFDYRYAGPTGENPFALHGTLASCPWQPSHLLARVAIKGREISNQARSASNLVFLIDVSGSMQDPVKLPLLKRSLRFLLGQLDERDHLGIVVYAGSEGVVLPPTTLDERGLSKAISALEKLEAGGSTNGGAGLKLAYAMAAQNLRPGAVNRVVLATDGDFNVGTTGQGELVARVKAEAAKGISLSVLGFGTGNLNDAMLEAITNDGNGNYYYIDGEDEARRVLQQKLTGTLVTIAKDVKIQVEFNPGKVKAYRLIGYANRILRHEDFNNDKVDAGDIGAGHTVTAFYEIVPQGVEGPVTGGIDDLRYQRPAGREAVVSEDWFTLKLRHKAPEGEISALIETIMKGEPLSWDQADNDFRFAAAVALFGMKLRQMPDAADVPWSKVGEIAKPTLADDREEQRASFVEMIHKLSR